MKFIQCQQGTSEWLQARAGAITASRFADALSTTSRASSTRMACEPTAASDKYAAEVAIERISGKPYGEPINAWILKRGHELEPKARLFYEQRYGATVMEVGIIKTDDDCFGYSTDGLVDDDGLVEIKCPVDSLKIVAMLKTGNVSEYMHQMHGGMWITGRQWCDFIMYVPDLENSGKQLYVKRVHRDDDFIGAMELQLSDFNKKVERIVHTIFRG
jgi:putative phage-type endonuclease